MKMWTLQRNADRPRGLRSSVTNQTCWQRPLDALTEMEPRVLLQKEKPEAVFAELQRRADAETDDIRTTSLNLTWHFELAPLAPEGRAKESWLASKVAVVQLLFQSLDDDLSGSIVAGEQPSVFRGHHCFQVASLWFDLFKKLGVGLLVADKWLRRCEAELVTIDEPSEDRKELKEDAEELREKIRKVVLQSTVEKLEELLVSGGVQAIIDRVKGGKEGDVWNRKAWSVLVMRALTELLDALSKVSRSAYTNEQISAVFYSAQLAELFALVKNKALSAWYSSESERLSNLVGLPTKEEGGATNILAIVEEAIKVSKSADEIFSVLSDKGNIVLTTFERSYIRIRLIRHNLLQFGDEVGNAMEQSSLKATNTLIEGLDQITELEHIPAPFKNLKSCEVLLANKEHVPIRDKQKCISTFKIACINRQISLFGPKDVAFMDAVHAVLRSCADVDSVSNALELRAFYDDRENACGRLVSRILTHGEQSPDTDEAMMSLYSVARDLDDHVDQWYIEEKLKELVWSYIRPVQVRKEVLDGRQVIEVKCKKTTLSKVLPEVLSRFEDPRVEEVRFVVTDCFRLDTNLDASVWHGVNIWIQTSKLQVASHVVLDVSGSNGTPATYHRKAEGGIKHGESGKKGDDGFAGESGGNVTIFAEEIKHQEWLTVLSRGGKGGRGQDGGDGMHGKDGFSHTYESLNEYLGQNSYISWKHDDLVITIGKAAATRIVWNPQKNFCHVKTKDGGEIMYSYNWDTQYAFTPHVPWHNRSFFLHKGGPGTAGGLGGMPGRGGSGGYGGSVEIIIKGVRNSQQTVNGTSGDNGTPGKASPSGKSGYDIAFTPNVTTSATWYGEDINKPKLLEVQFTNEKPYGNWTWCPYHYKYALIVESNRTVSYQQSLQVTRKDNSQLQTQASANKKKNISTESMLNTYQAYAESLRVTNFEEMLKRETAELHSLSAVSVKETLRISVHRERQIAVEPALFSGGWEEHSAKNIKSVDKQTAEKYVSDLETNPSDEEKWTDLKYFLPNVEQFKRLFEAQDNISTSADMKQFLLAKYRTNSLQEIASNGENHFSLFCRQQPAGPIEKYICGEKVPTTIMYDTNVQESVRKHFEKLQQITGQQDGEDETLRRAIKFFAEEARENEVLKRYVDECSALEAEKEQAWQRYLAVLEKNPPAYDLWVRAYNGERVEDELRAAIAQDEAAQTALVAFCAAPDYDWNAAAKDEKVLKEVSAFLAASGSLSSACFREVLADSTNQHIRVYHRDNNDGEAFFKLTAEHGEKHTTKLYIHQKSAGKFRRLQFDREYFDMECTRQHKSDVFTFVLEKMNSLNTKEEIDSFVVELVPSSEVGGRVFEDFVLSHTTKEERYDEQRESNFDTDVESVVKHFPSIMRSFLTGKLELLNPRYAPNGVVSSLARRLAVEQLQVSSEVFHWLVDLAVEAVANDSATVGLYEFIAAANRQEDWASELLLIQLDNHLRKEIANKDDLRNKLANVSDQVMLLLSNKLKHDTFLGQKRTISEEVIQELVTKLAASGDDVFTMLKDVGVDEWVFVLEEISWRKKLEGLAEWEEEKLQESVHFLSTLAKNRKMAIVTSIMNKVTEKPLFKDNASAMHELLFYLQSDDCHMSNTELLTLVSNGGKKITLSQDERNFNDLATIIKNNANTSRNFKKNVESISAMFENVSSLSPKQAKDTANQLNPMITHNRSASLIDEGSLKAYLNLVNAVDSVIKNVMGFNLRATQKLSAMLLLTNENKSLIQVATGEGKTMIVLVVAIIKALCGQKVHIVTSSSVLAKRDATSEENVQIYSAFGVTVSHNCSENVEERKSAYSTSQVVYGDLSNFQRDHLLDNFYDKKIMGDHTRKEVMIIDEVDSMLLDKGNNMLYLSHDIGDLDKLDCVFAFIWQGIHVLNKDIMTEIDADLIKCQIISDLYSSITREDLHFLDKTLSLVQVEELWDRLQTVRIIDKKGVLISEDSWSEESLHEACTLPGLGYDPAVLKDRLRYLLEQLRDRKRVIEVPNFLKQFVTLHVDVWIRNAIQALSMEADRDYVVDVDRSNVSADVFPLVTILDKDTGTDQANSQWDDGLHQFLQIKHGCKLSPLSLKAVFISNVTYLKLYANIYGMTGTLGTSKEKEMLQRVHDVDFVVMPTFKPKKFVELPPVVSASRRAWISEIVKETADMLDTKGRAVLVICETINEVRTLTEALHKAGRANVLTYTRDYETFELPGGKLEPGHVVLATNLAGRGTDIKPSKALLKAGGLHVVLTYLPHSGRVEQQAFGRAARKGDPGTGRLVVCVLDEGGTSTLRVADMRARRDAKSHDTTEEFYKNQILGEEAYMTHFTGLYKRLEEKLGNYPKELKHALLQFYIDKWALWLDKNEKSIDMKQSKKKLEAEICFDRHISENYELAKVLSLLNFLDQPSTIVKIGKYFLDDNADTSIQLFDAVAQREPLFSESALYYKCAAKVKLLHELDKKSKRKEDEAVIREDLRLAARAIDRRKSFVMQTARMIASVRKNQVRVTEKDAFQIQTENLVLVYETFKKSIEEICGAPLSGFELGDGDAELGEQLETDLFIAGILQDFKVKDPQEIPIRDLQKLCCDYGISCERLLPFLTQLKGKQSVKEFEKLLEEHIILHTAKGLWEILCKRGTIRDEQQLVAIIKDAAIFESRYPALKKESSKSDTQSDTFLYSAQLPATNESKIYFRKSDLVNEVGVEKFKELLKEKEAIELKRAVLAKEVLLDTDLLLADYVTLKDLEVTGIANRDAVLILRELEEQNILEKRGELSYFLVSHDFQESLELSLPLYEETVVNFLAVSFAYDLAFARIKRRVIENPTDTAIQIPLMSHPHRGLLMDLFNCDALERPRVDPNREDITEKVRELNTFELEVADVEKVCQEHMKRTHAVSQHNANDLYALLQEYQWLLEKTIQGPDKRLSLAKSQYSDLQQVLAKLFDTRFKLASMVDSLAKTLEHGRGLLSILSHPAVNLKLLRDEAKTQAVNIEELTVFELNGFEHLIMLGEKKYTIWMILGASAVILMGLSQIVLGVLIEVYLMGAMTFVGGALIGEGIGDIIYGIGALFTGVFSWKDYGIQKAVNVALSIATAGVGAFINRGEQASRFGIKLLGSARGKGIAGKALVKEVGAKRLFLSATKRVGQKVGVGFAKGVAIIGIDQVAELSAKSVCVKLVAEVAKNFDTVFEDSDVLRQTLKDVLSALGPHGAKNLVMSEVHTLLESTEVLEELENYIKSISNDTLKQFEGGNLSAIAKRIIILAEQGINLLARNNYGMTICKNIIIRLNTALNNKKIEQKEEMTNIELATLKEEIKQEFRNLMIENVTLILYKNRVKPCVGNAAKEAYETSVQSKCFELKEDQERKTLENLRSTSGTQRRTFAANMGKVLALCKDPSLLANFILADVPLGAIGFQAIASAISAMSKTDVTIIVQGDGTNPTQTYSGKVDTTGTWPQKEVQVDLDSDMITTAQPEGGRNARLFAKLALLLPGELDASQFQKLLAEAMQSNVEVQRAMRRGWHLEATLGLPDPREQRLALAIVKSISPEDGISPSSPSCSPEGGKSQSSPSRTPEDLKPVGSDAVIADPSL